MAYSKWTYMLAAASCFVYKAAFGNVVGVDMQNFNPTPDGLDYVTVQSTKTLDRGYANFGLFLNLATNSLPYYETTEEGDDTSGTNQRSFSPRDTLTSIDFNAAYGINDRWSIGASLPQILDQQAKTPEGDPLRGQFGQEGITELRLNTKFRLLGPAEGRNRSGLATVFTLNHNLIQDNPWTGSNPGPTVTGEIAVDRSFGDTSAALNFGYRARSPGKPLAEAPVAPLGDQWIASLGASTLIKGISTKAIGEIFGGVPVKKTSDNSDRQLSSLEALFGLKHDASSALAIHGGAATELIHGRASPDWRLYAGINYVIGPPAEKSVARKRKKRSVTRPTPRPALRDYAGTTASASGSPLIDDQPELGTETIANPEQNLFRGTPPQSGIETFVISDVHFAFDRDRVVLTGAKTILKNLAEYLLREPRFKSLVIEGHTDYMGSDTYNLDLSQRRAIAIRNYLVDILQIDGNKITTLGKGENEPIADNGNYQGRQLNRRVEFTIDRGQ